MPDVSKTCTKCGELKPFSDFGKRAASRDGHQHRCRTCFAAWHASRKALRKVAAASWYRRNKEAHNARNRAWRENHRDAHQEMNREWFIRNPERAAELRRASASLRRARERGVPVVAFTQDQLDARVAFYGGKCWICRVGRYEHLDHVKPISAGGPHMLSNLRPACSSCNLRKSAAWPFPLTSTAA